MNIRDWPVDRIMQLPDHCFGRKIIVSCAPQAPGNDTGWDISEIALPERAVLWQFSCWSVYSTSENDSFRLALGDQLPTSTVMMDALEPLFPGFGLQGPGPRKIWMAQYGAPILFDFRIPLMSGGRRLVTEMTTIGAVAKDMIITLIVSSMPTEVPDWLCSARV